MVQQGLYIIFDGGEGAGKSTQARRLVERLQSLELPVYLTREPGGTILGERVRSILLDPESGNMATLTEFLLFSASRAELMLQVNQLLQQGTIVISDRSFISSLAYQCYGRGVDLEFAKSVSQFVTQSCPPDLILIFNVDYHVGIERRLGRGTTDRMEQEEDEFHLRVNEGFLTEARLRGLPLIDGNQSPDQVAEAIWAHVEPLTRRYAHDRLTAR